MATWAFLIAMPDKTQLLDVVKSRSSRMGVITADRYFREVEGCLNGGFCPVDMVGAKSDDQWRKALKDAEQKLAYCNSRTKISQRSIDKSPSEGILTFDAIVTTTLRDRDGDILETKGCDPDKDMPLLWQHIAMSPIGRMVQVGKRTDNEMRAKFVVADTALGRDAATLIKLKALRISHGFEPIDWDILEDEKGFHFLKWKMFEVSVVSIPSNVQAVITNVSKSKWASSLVKGWADHLNPSVQVTVPVSLQSEPDAASETSTSEAEGEATLTVDKSAEACTCKSAATSTEDNAELATEEKSVEEPVHRTFDDISHEYMAHLAKANTDVLRREHRRLSLILRSAEEQEEAREWESLMCEIA